MIERVQGNVRRYFPAIVVWCATVAYAALATYFSVRRHDAYLSGFDVATLDQETWLLAHWHEPLNTQDGRLFWGEHFSLTMVLLVPLYWLGAGPTTLLVIQALAMAAVAPLLYALARAYSAPPWLAVLPALLWLASPLTLFANTFDVHHIPLVAPAIVGSVLALKKGRLTAFAGLAVLACFAKEDVSLLYAMLGIVVVLEGRRRLGAAITAAAATLFVVATAVVMPAFSDAASWHADRFAGARGESLSDVAGWMATHPLATLTDLLTAQNIGVCLALVVATGGLCLLAPRWMLLGLPTLAFNLLSAYPTQHELSTHYFVPVMLAFSIASAVGVHRLAVVGPFARLAIAAFVLTALVTFGFGVGVARSDSEWSRADVSATGGPDARRQALALIPNDVPVATTPRLSAHLSQRREIYTLPLPFLGREEAGADWSVDEMMRRASRVQWVALDSTDRPAELMAVPELIPPVLAKLGFREVFRQGSVAVYTRDRASNS